MLTDEAQMHERVQPTAEEGGRNLPVADGGAEAGTAAVGRTKARAPLPTTLRYARHMLPFSTTASISNGARA
ncbi:hypothetical protein, partial [Burkholderia cenocepacia]|uniref:hypothetical protein n=1 Tax=Burkholderia cenocepacia TaxID=95486 RepID=UPI0024B82F4A